MGGNNLENKELYTHLLSGGSISSYSDSLTLDSWPKLLSQSAPAKPTDPSLSAEGTETKLSNHNWIDTFILET